MAQASIDQLIINSPYEEPAEHWRYDRESRSFSRLQGRRPAGYVRATPGAKTFDDPGVFVELPLVNRIRERVKAWREHPENPYAGTTGITQRLLQHWRDPEQRGEDRRLFFCQLEAIETLIWLIEAPAAERQGIEIPSDGGEFTRLCAKMATGSGKTIVMAMTIAWQVLNKVTYPQDKRFSKNIFVVAPGLTVKKRLKVLGTSSAPGNYYDEFKLIPAGIAEKLRQGKVFIRNWHMLMPLDPGAGPRVEKKGPESDEAFARRVLEDLAGAQNLLVINDEAHHAWRVPSKSRVPGISKDELEEATQWIGGLDRIHKTRGLLNCIDFTATPFAPTGRVSGEETLFDWVVSDFGLNDAIESGLVKTPRVVVRDDGAPAVKTYKSKLYHIYEYVKDDLNRKALEQQPLPDLMTNAYYLLGKDWLETFKTWKQSHRTTPPVMITVANRTETAARVDYAFRHGNILIEELQDPARILHIDSKVLEKAEAREEAPELDSASGNGDDSDDAAPDERPVRKESKKDKAERLRQIVDTVGRVGEPGENIQAVISVGMLSEGWDAKTVTHIMGLRAFTSQLLCEQVVGRGLRRTSYEIRPGSQFFDPEYVNIFGVPFTFLPHEGGDGPPPPPPPPKTRIEPVPEKQGYEVSWPNVIRIDHEYRPHLKLDFAKVKPLLLDANDPIIRAELARMIEGKPELTSLTQIDLMELGRRFRMQKVIFEMARNVYDQMKPTWKANREYLLAQLVGLVEGFIRAGRIQISPPLFAQDELRRRIIITLNMAKLVQHLWEEIRFENAEGLVPVFDDEHPIRSTGDMRPWFTGRPCEPTQHSHVNFCVFDSTWESSEEFEIDSNSNVAAWVKNDHLGFEIVYVFKGIVKKYRPDFLIRLTDGTMLVLEVKGQESPQSKTKHGFLAEWIEAVNGHGGFGKWSWAVSYDRKDVRGLPDTAAGGE